MFAQRIKTCLDMWQHCCMGTTHWWCVTGFAWEWSMQYKWLGICVYVDDSKYVSVYVVLPYNRQSRKTHSWASHLLCCPKFLWLYTALIILRTCAFSHQCFSCVASFQNYFSTSTKASQLLGLEGVGAGGKTTPKTAVLFLKTLEVWSLFGCFGFPNES